MAGSASVVGSVLTADHVRPGPVCRRVGILTIQSVIHVTSNETRASHVHCAEKLTEQQLTEKWFNAAPAKSLFTGRVILKQIR